MRGAWIEILEMPQFFRIAMSSLPVRGEWIEICRRRIPGRLIWSLPVRGAWIEITHRHGARQTLTPSLPVRGEWIEILSASSDSQYAIVAPCEGSVD